jgi:hypothetical protein
LTAAALPKYSPEKTSQTWYASQRGASESLEYPRLYYKLSSNIYNATLLFPYKNIGIPDQDLAYAYKPS